MKRVFLLVLLMLLTGHSLFSQDCSSFYRNAMNEARKQNVSSFQTAIKLYESAKRCYSLVNDATGVMMCDERISECRAAIAQMNVRLSNNNYNQEYGNFVSFEVSSENVEFTAKGGKETISITGNTTWAIPSLKGWYKVVKNGDEGIEITAEENKSAEARSGYFSIRYSSNREKMIRISQEGIEPVISFSERNITFSSDANWDKKITVSSNAEWEIVDAPYWCKAIRIDEKLILTPQINDEDEIRTGSIIIVAGSKKETLNIRQESEYLRVTPASYTFAKAGGKMEFRIQYPGMESSPFEVKGNNSDWYTISKPDDNRIIVQCLPNKKNTNRTETIIIKRKGQEVKINIEQDGKK